MLRSGALGRNGLRNLLLPHDPSEIHVSQIEQAFQLGNPLLADLAGGMRGLGFVQEALRLFLVGPRHIKGVFQCCLVLESRVVFHENSLVPFPG